MTDGTAPSEELPRGSGMTIQVYTVNRHGTVTSDRGTTFVPARAPEATPVEEEAVTGVVTVCAEAQWFLAQETLPRHQTVQGLAREFSACLSRQIPCVEKLAGERGLDDPQAMTALAGVATARRRMNVPVQRGLVAEVERVGQLARSVLALHTHVGTLTDARTGR
ncbi:hypothetical protein IAG44_14285 [Streptomyces roseirectus]|uniref:Uncharacterized protein n=1 Tax=Streptomyces roseirectus TaxID=2768066 RepID=A0A7H0ICH7_9ACTN|nr:DUF6415 family natural product biosynthesis protein [Streptomyces roseirectus]QNP70493.1 hypothetical protein IAG44_14285 [Streptomyces roseirectus]